MIKFKVSLKSDPFKDVRHLFTSKEALKEILDLSGSLLDRKAKAGARSAIGGNFGDQIARSVSYRTAPKTLTVGSSHYAAVHKQFGGKISAPGKGPGSTGAKMLAIPIDPAAKGKSPREINGLFLVAKKGQGQAFLARDNGDGGIQAMFVLVKSVTQKAYPWFPLGKDAEDQIKKAIEVYLKRRGNP